MREENCDLENSPRAGSQERSIGRLYEAACRRRFYPIDFARAPGAKQKSTTEMKDLDINIGHNRPTPEAPPTTMTVAAPRMTVRSVSTHPSSYSARRGDQHVTMRVEDGRGRIALGLALAVARDSERMPFRQLPEKHLARAVGSKLLA